MLVYDLLATLWETTSTDLEIAHAVEARQGVQISRNIVNQHIRLLLNTGHITAKNANGMPAYALTPRGSELLATFAEAEINVSLS
jgi:hypothetical protein